MTTKKEETTDTAAVPLVSDEVLDELLTRADAQGTELLGADGLLNHLTKAVLERALAEELTDHLGYWFALGFLEALECGKMRVMTK